MDINKHRKSRLGARLVTFVFLGAAVLSFGMTPSAQVKEYLQQPGIKTFQYEIQHVLTVCSSGPPTCQYRKIQDAIDAAPEDLVSAPQPRGPITKIVVAPGIYEENLVIGKSVVLEGAGRDKVILRPSSKIGQAAEVGILVVTNVYGVFVDISGIHIQRTDRGNSVSVMVLGALALTRLHQNRFESSIDGVHIEASLSNVIEENEFLFSGNATTCHPIDAITLATLWIRRNIFPDRCFSRIVSARQNPYGRELTKPGERLLIEENQGGEFAILDSAAVLIQRNKLKGILLDHVETVVIQENEIQFRKGNISVVYGIWIKGSRDVAITKNVIEDNLADGIIVSKSDTSQSSSISLMNNRVLRNEGFGVITDNIDSITVCQGNEVKENKKGDYGVGPEYSAQPSLALKQKCEGN
ncbi:right-handed parallel beta-helix repeat-containing protein [Candidatus Acetothermia bacterium]|nr:right-handed parallel beta-helix repeat-containing protein [Candidatus Acetothermia bacterium]